MTATFNSTQSYRFPYFPPCIRAEVWQAQGHAIPTSGRVVAVADTFEALTSDRPYRPAYPFDEAIQILIELRGRQLDPESVGALIDSFGKDRPLCETVRAANGRATLALLPPAA